MYKYAAIALAVLCTISVSVYGGYSLREAKCERDFSAFQLEVSDALAILARQYATADTRYREEKRKRLEIIWDIREAIFEETTHSYDIFVYNKIDFESNLNLTTSIENQINSHGIILYEQN